MKWGGNKKVVVSTCVQIRIHACMEMNGLLQNDTENVYALKIALKNM